MRFTDVSLGKVEGCPKSEQTRLQTPERKTTDLREKQASFYIYVHL